MKLSLFISIACLIIQSPSFGQAAAPVNINTQITRLKNSKADTTRVNILLALAKSYSNSIPPKPDSATYYALQAQQLSNRLHYQRGLGNTYLTYTQIFRQKKQIEKAKVYLNKAIAIFAGNNLYRDAAEAHLLVSDFYNPYNSRELKQKVSSYEQAIHYFQLAGAKVREADALKILADFHSLQGKQSEALAGLKRALNIYLSANYKQLQATYDLIGYLSAQIGDYKEGLRYGLLAVKTAEALQDTSLQLCTIYNRLAVTYNGLHLYEDAMQYFQKSIKIARKYRDLNAVMTLTANISANYLRLNKPQKALVFLKEIEKEYPSNELSNQILLNARLLDTYTKLKQYNTAQLYAGKLVTASARLDKTDMYRDLIYRALITYYLATKQFELLNTSLIAYNELCKAHGYTVGLADNHLWWFKLDSARNNYASAMEHFRQYTALKDSLFNETKSKQIAQLNIQYQTEKKDQQIKLQEQHINLLTKQKKLQQKHLQQVRLGQNITIAGAAILFMLLGVIYSRYRLKQVANQKLEAQQNEINHKNHILEQLATQKDVLLEEKEWLMKEIHHRVKNNLQIVISLLNTQSVYLNDDKAHAAIRESQHRMQSIAFIHQKLYQSESRALIEAHIYINELIDYLSSSFDIGKRICFEKNLTTLELDVSRAVPMGLILNEAITNAIKYAFPGNREGCITVSLCCLMDDTFQLCVGDNGIGLPVGFDVDKCRSLGVNLMRGLSKQIGSKLKLENNNGVMISVEFKDEKLLRPA